MNRNKISILTKIASLEFDKIAIQMLAPFGLTPSQYKILKLLYSKPADTVRQKDIERFFSMTNPTVTGILNNLEKNQWIERIRNPNDSRSKVIRLTEKAENYKTELITAGNEIENQMTERLDDKERAELVGLLKKMLGK